VQKAEQARARRALAKQHLIEYACYTDPNYLRARHLEYIANELEEFEAGIVRGDSLQILIIETPPQHGKSSLVSQKFPEWVIGRHPDWSIILTSATKDLPDTFSRSTRNTILENERYHLLFPDVRIAKDSAARDKWMLEGRDRPTVRATGAEGQIVGNPAKILVIDDPLKNFAEAKSRTVRDGQWRWWTTTARSRVAQRGGVVLMLTRWDMDDIAGRMIEAALKGGDKVRVVRLPALAESQIKRDKVNQKMGLPAGLPDPLGRGEGEALWAERYDAPYLLQTKAVDPDAFETLYQANPVPFESTLLPRERFKVIAWAPPEITHWCRGWDLAFKASEKNDYTSSARVAFGADGSLYISRVMRYKREWPDSREIIITQGQIETDTDIAVESVAAQAMAWQELAREQRLANRKVIEVTVDSDKRLRATGWSWRRIFLVAESDELYAPWLEPFLQEAEVFPGGMNDDQVDGLSVAVAGSAVQGTNKTVTSAAQVAKVDVNRMFGSS